MKYIQAEGNGQGQCTRCKEEGRWSQSWMCFLYKVEGKKGCYCFDCITQMIKEEEDENNNSTCGNAQ